MSKRRNTWMALFAALLMVTYLVPAVEAQTSPNAAGTWKWTQTGGGGGRRGGPGGGGPGGGAGAPGAQPPATQPGGGAARGPGGGGRGGFGQPTELTLTLKQEGDKLTGQMLGMPAFGGGEPAPIEIREGTIKDGTVSFKVVRTIGENEFTTLYTGKLEGDKITGTREVQIPGGGPGGPGGAGGGPGGPGGAGAAPGPGGGAPGAGGAGRGPGGGGRGGFGGPQEWVAERQK